MDYFTVLNIIPMTEIINTYFSDPHVETYVASFPYSRRGGESASYTLFVYVQLSQDFGDFGNYWILHCNVVLSIIVLSFIACIQAKIMVPGNETMLVLMNFCHVDA